MKPWFNPTTSPASTHREAGQQATWSARYGQHDNKPKDRRLTRRLGCHHGPVGRQRRQPTHRPAPRSATWLSPWTQAPPTRQQTHKPAPRSATWLSSRPRLATTRASRRLPANRPPADVRALRRSALQVRRAGAQVEDQADCGGGVLPLVGLVLELEGRVVVIDLEVDAVCQVQQLTSCLQIQK